MPVVHVHLWHGFSEEKIKEVIKGITEVFTKMNIPVHAVEVLIHEVPKSHWGIEGKPATESRPDTNVPK
ncbi:MAG: 4-oxalocrotonate tautomerase [Candidatus Heimdallarchaeota archaeon]|nr:4-oxalocrotonate tautomerase [Candidatus Heimdallarchaeota archaeon]MCG3253892.1 tautomerase family protein [Candidatus Heimdallarchaeota archaeon]MCK4291025.1 tautomerase family protein [Candidatus Heimdallarchaeota archaeon]